MIGRVILFVIHMIIKKWKRLPTKVDLKNLKMTWKINPKKALYGLLIMFLILSAKVKIY